MNNDEAAGTRAAIGGRTTMGVRDLLISGGSVVDGAGNPWFHADVAVSEGAITEIAPQIDGPAARTIDACGMIVAPGFIDIHTHAEAGLRSIPTADNYLQQGVTTVVGGNCGDSPLPLRDVLDWFDNAALSCNLALLVGHNAIRRDAMGLVPRDPRDDEMARMKASVADAMDAGAFGLSLGLKYVPGAYTKIDEIVELARVSGERGGIITSHLRSEGLSLLDAVREMLQVARRTRLPVHLSHHKAAGKASWGAVKDTLAMVDEVRELGLDVTLDQYPYTASCTNLTVLFPAWALAEDADGTLMTRLQDPAVRPRIKEELAFNIEYDRGSGDPANVVIVSCASDEDIEGKNLAQVTMNRGLSPTAGNAAEVLMDIVLECQQHGQAVYHCMSEEDVRTVMQHPDVMFASDGWVVPHGKGWTHPRLYGTFPRILARYVREEGVLPLEEAVRKMTSLPAQRMSFRNRGMLRTGMRADITIFDPDRVQDTATWDAPQVYPEGIRMVIVNGQVTVQDGEHTGALAGKVLRNPAAVDSAG